MKIQAFKTTNNKLINSSFGILVLFCVILYGLAIFQDYVFSEIQFTGFYWSETMLYNTFWLLFIPFIKIANLQQSSTQITNQ